jgi:hypothetical protein
MIARDDFSCIMHMQPFGKDFGVFLAVVMKREWEVNHTSLFFTPSLVVAHNDFFECASFTLIRGEPSHFYHLLSELIVDCLCLELHPGLTLTTTFGNAPIPGLAPEVIGGYKHAANSCQPQQQPTISVHYSSS